MKSPDEIKKGIGCCFSHDECDECPYGGDYIACFADDLKEDIIAYIQQLEADNSRKDDTIRSLTEQLNAAHEETAKAMRERDMAVDALHGDCSRCMFQQTAKCASCRHDTDAWNVHDDFWEWEGVSPDTEVQDG